MSFLEKYKLLKKSIPVPALANDTYSQNCDTADYFLKSKNCFYSFNGYYLEDSAYVLYGGWSNKLFDCGSVYESEKCFECVDLDKCNSCTYSIDCNNSTDCHFSTLLNSCTDCFGCVALTHKKYCILNIQYTKGEYFKKIEELKKEKPEKLLEQMLELKQQIPHPASLQNNNENCPFGDYIYNSKDCYWAFKTFYNENCGYTFYTSRSRNCWDMFRSGGTLDSKSKSERCYELFYCLNNYNSAFLYNCHNCTNVYYGNSLFSCSDCFGCVGLTKKKYCILNNQLTKDQYNKTLKEIKKELGWQIS